MNREDISIRVRALIRIWANQGMPAILVWAVRMRTGPGKMAHMRMGSVREKYVYGTEHIHVYLYTRTRVMV